MIKDTLKILLPLLLLLISSALLQAETAIEDIVRSVEKMDSISIDHIGTEDVPDTLSKSAEAYGKLKQTFQQIDLNRSQFNFGNNQIITLFAIFLISFILFFIIAFNNAKERYKLENNLQKEHGKLNKRIDDRTKKLKVAKRDLEYEIMHLKQSGIDLKNLKSAVEKMRLGVIMTDLDGKIIYTNRANAAIHGYTPLELIGSDSSILTIDVVRKKFTKRNKREWMGKVIRSSDQKKDGSSFIVEISADMVSDDNGEPVAIIMTCEDLTGKENSRKALINSEENFKRLFENIQDIYYEVDIDGRIKEISPSVKGISDLGRNELIGQPMVNLYYNKEQRDNFLKALKKDEQVNDFEIVMKGKENLPVPCSLTAKLMLDKNGLPSEIIGSIRNITERKKVEEQRNMTLEDLTRANKELRNFAYVTSHDLKSPLRAINTIANWISKDYDDKFDDDGKQQMKLLIGRTERMHQLIEGLFLYSNVTGKEQLNKVNVTELLGSMIESLNLPLHISITIGDSLPNVIYNKTRLSQIFSSLIENSLKFSLNPQTAIVINCFDKKDEWIFSVADNGPGIAEKYHEKIFQIFQTLQTRDEIETAGVGLAVVKKITEMNDGRIWVESEENAGSKFFFTIPQKRAVKE